LNIGAADPTGTILVWKVAVEKNKRKNFRDLPPKNIALSIRKETPSSRQSNGSSRRVLAQSGTASFS
jgi:hypothetical protein